MWAGAPTTLICNDEEEGETFYHGRSFQELPNRIQAEYEVCMSVAWEQGARGLLGWGTRTQLQVRLWVVCCGCLAGPCQLAAACLHHLAGHAATVCAPQVHKHASHCGINCVWSAELHSALRSGQEGHRCW